MKPWKLKSDTFPVAIYLFPTVPGAAVRTYMEKEYPGVDAKDWCHHEGQMFSVTRVCNQKKSFFIWLARFRKTNPRDIAFLAHEVVHLVQAVFVYLNISIPEHENNEYFAYYVTDLFDQCYGLLTKKAKRKT